MEDMVDQVQMDFQVPRETVVSMVIRVQREREDRQAAAPDQEDQDPRVIPDVKGLPVHQDLKASPADPDKMVYQDQKVDEVCLVRPGQRAGTDRRASLDLLVLMAHLVKMDNLDELDQRDPRENQDSLVFPEEDSQGQRAAMDLQVNREEMG